MTTTEAIQKFIVEGVERFGSVDAFGAALIAYNESQKK